MNMAAHVAYQNAADAGAQGKSSEGWKRTDSGAANFLIISEDISTCLYVEILAHQDGVHARYFTEPTVALSAFERNPDHWSLVFVDTLSPLMNRLSLASKLKAIKPDVRLVMLAHQSPEQIREHFGSKSACGLCGDCSDARRCHCFFLHKPFYRDFDRVIETAMKAA